MSDTLIRVRVSPGARRPAVVGRYADGWKVRVSAAPERGRANAELVRLIAVSLGVPERQVTVAAGHRSRDKTLAVEGVAAAEAEKRLEAAAAR